MPASKVFDNSSISQVEGWSKQKVEYWENEMEEYCEVLEKNEGEVDRDN